MEQTESRIQQDCVIWLWNSHPETRKLLFAVPNGGSRNAIEAKRFKAEGLIAGVSDLLFMWRGRTHCIEMKTPTGRQQKNQIEWQGIVEANGFDYHVIRSLEEFKNLINKIMNERDVLIHWRPRAEKYHEAMCEKFGIPTHRSVNGCTRCKLSTETIKQLRKAEENELIAIVDLDELNDGK